MTALLSVEELQKSFGGVRAVADVTLDMSAGEALGLIGPNGAGKTTFVNLITGHSKPDRGRVFWSGQETTSLPVERVARAGVARTYQHMRLLEGRSVLDNVLVGLHKHLSGGLATVLTRRRQQERQARERARECVHRLGLDGLESASVSSLPYGLRRRVEIARALVSEPKALLLDEPTAGMTHAEAADIADTVRAVRSDGIGVLLIEHNVGLVTSLCDRLAVLEWGALIAVGRPDDVWLDDRVQAAYLGAS